MILLQSDVIGQATKMATTDWEKVGIITLFALMFSILLSWYVYRESYHTKQARLREKEFWAQTQEREAFWEARLDEERKNNDKESQTLLAQILKGADLTQNLFYLMDKMLRKFGVQANKDELQKLIDNQKDGLDGNQNS